MVSRTLTWFYFFSLRELLLLSPKWMISVQWASCYVGVLYDFKTLVCLEVFLRWQRMLLAFCFFTGCFTLEGAYHLLSLISAIFFSNLILVLTSSFLIYHLSNSVLISACQPVRDFTSAGAAMEWLLAGLILDFILYIGRHFCWYETHWMVVVIVI